MKTTIEEREIIKQYIKQLKKLNNDGRIKILETDSRADIKDVSEINKRLGLEEAVLGTFVDVALYIHS